MFDQTPSNLPTAPAGTPRPNLNPPTPEPNRPVLRAVQPEEKIDDIFAETDHGGAPIVRPTQPGQAINLPTRPKLETEEDIFGGKAIWKNKILIVSLIILAAGIAIGIGMMAFNYFSQAKINRPATNTNLNSNINNQNTNQSANTNQLNNENSQAVAPKDSDSDGLTDEEEKALGTDPKNFDSDADGLIDSAEVNIYKTDPLNADTDGDGYQDGQEVINGYDPAKAGNAKLFQTPNQ